MRFRVTMPGLCLLLALLQMPTPAQQRPGYVGSNVCKTCHAPIAASFFRNPHNRPVTADVEPQACESCHGPGKAHVEARGGKNNIVAFSLLKPGEVLNACLECHSSTFSRANIRRSEHTLADIACNGCHSIHRSTTPKNLLAKRQIDLCYDCHSQVRAQFSMPVKHRVNEGFMQCSDCHNPHGAYAPTWRMGAKPRMQDLALANEQSCLKCHSDKRGPFVYEHAAIRVDGCESCHFPHGSTNARLLRRPVVFTLCLECHNGLGNFGRNGDGIPTQSGSHNMADPKYQNCTACHVRIHGSNSSQTFLR